MMEELQTPPHRLGFEKSVLSSMLQNPAEYIPRAVEGGLTPEKFYQPSHARFFELMRDTQNAGKLVEIVALTEDVMRSGDLDSLGGASAITEIYTYAPTAAHFESHLENVLATATLREIIRVCTKSITAAYQDQNAKELLEKCELEILRIGQESESGTSYNGSLKSGFADMIEYLQSPSNPGMPIGIPAIDEMTGGIRKKEVMIFGARPAVGKTSFSCTIAANMAIKDGRNVAIFVMEGSKLDLTGRIAAGETGISSKRIRDKAIVKGDVIKLKRLMEESANANLHIDDRMATASEIAARIRRLHQKEPLDVIVIDYIGKVLPSSPEERANPKLMITNATNIIHETCKSLNIALVILAQLSRQKDDYDPQMHHLADSASLERDGDIIVFAANKKEIPDDLSAIRQVLFRLGKNRHGPTGDRDVNFNPNTTRFY